MTIEPSSSRRVLGIDPGLNITGYGVLEVDGPSPSICEAGVVRTGEGSLEERLVVLYRGVRDVIEEFKPRVVALEELYSHYQHPKTAILMGHARGVICLAAAEASVPLHHYAATQVKRMLTGAGRASKQQVQSAICREFRLAEPPEPPDVADALAIALCHHHQTHLAALKR